MDIRYNGPGPAEAGPHVLAGPHGRGKVAGLAAGAALLGGLVYLNALHNPFVYDDYHTVVQNGSIADVTNLRAIVLGALTRPIVNFSYALDRAVWGIGPFGFHVTNVLLHMLNVVLLFALARQLGKRVTVAFAGAALFAVHPMMTEAVGYISGRSEVLCATFFILALMSGRLWILGSRHVHAALTVGLWFAALATKESAAMFPLVFLVYDWFTAHGTAAERRRRLMTVHAPLVGFALVAGLARLAILARVEYPGQVSMHWSYVLLELDVIRRYVWMMVNPSGQALFHSVAPVGLFDLRAVAGVVVVGSMAALGWKIRRVDPVAGVGLLWFLFALVPSSALIALDQGEPMAEHRVYLASVGMFLAIGAGLGRIGQAEGTEGPAKAGPHVRTGGSQVLAGPAEAGPHVPSAGPHVPSAGPHVPSAGPHVPPHVPSAGPHVQVRRFAGGVAFALVVTALGGLTIVRNAVWADPVALWRESVDLAPQHYRPRLLLGEALQDAGRRTEAIEEYRTAIRLRPGDPAGYVKVGQCLAEVGKFAEARAQFLQAMAVDPGNAPAARSLEVLGSMETMIKVNGDRR